MWAYQYECALFFVRWLHYFFYYISTCDIYDIFNSCLIPFKCKFMKCFVELAISKLLSRWKLSEYCLQILFQDSCNVLKEWMTEWQRNWALESRKKYCKRGILDQSSSHISPQTLTVTNDQLLPNMYSNKVGNTLKVLIFIACPLY